MEKDERPLYQEPKDFANRYRVDLLNQLKAALEDRRKAADRDRADYFKPDYSSTEAFTASVEQYRNDLISMLGWPLNEYSECLPLPRAEVEPVAEDSLGSILRLTIGVMQGVTSYGLLFLPTAEPPYPLVISQHGGAGTPELCSGFFGSANYNDMTRQVLKRGFAVFAPQLILWGEDFGPKVDNAGLDAELKQLGGSLAAYELFRLKRSIDYLHSRSDIIVGQTGMIGLSYGGFYTLYAAAADLRIKAALSSCFFNNRFAYPWPDWAWFDSGRRFLDAEICALICPRPLYIEVGDKDEIFDADGARREYVKVRNSYEMLGQSRNLRFKVFDGVHELDRDDDGIDFLCQSLCGINVL